MQKGKGKGTFKCFGTSVGWHKLSRGQCGIYTVPVHVPSGILYRGNLVKGLIRKLVESLEEPKRKDNAA